MVGSGSDMGDSKEFHPMFPKMGQSGGGWDAELYNPIKQERLDDHFRTGDSEQDDF